MDLTITSREVREITVLVLGGEFDQREAYARVRWRVKQLIEGGKNKILFDLAQLERIDSGGLGTLAEALVAARKQGGAVKLLNVSEKIRKLFVLTNLISLFEIHDDEPAALASFSRPLEPG